MYKAILATLLSLSASCLVSAAPAAYATGVPLVEDQDPSQIIAELSLIGKDKDHVYIVPYCDATPVNISVADAEFALDTSNDTTELPPGMSLYMISMTKPVDLTPFNNALGIMVIDYKLPTNDPNLAKEVNLTAVMMVSNSSNPFSNDTFTSQESEVRVIPEMAVTFNLQYADSTENGASTLPTEAGFTAIASRMTVDDEKHEIKQATLADGRYLVELAYMVAHPPTLDVSSIGFSDIFISCLPQPAGSQLEAQGITYYKIEQSDGSYVVSPTLQASK